MKSIFGLAGNLSLVLTKLDNELGLAQSQLVNHIIHMVRSHTPLLADVVEYQYAESRGS